MKIVFILVRLVLVIFLVGLGTLEAQKKATIRTLVGSISGFECGDNCYLLIKDEKGKVHTGLCAARACDVWNDETQIPGTEIGRRVKVTVGKGNQYDGSGRLVGKMDAFTRIEFLSVTPFQGISTCKFCGIWEYSDYGIKYYLSISRSGEQRFKLATGFIDLAGQIEWSEPEIKNGNAILLTQLGEKLTGQFVSSNFLPTHGRDFTYRITISFRSDNKINYSVGNPGRKTDTFVATKIRD